MTKFLTQYRHWFLGLSFLLAVVCAILSFHVNINTDMSKYLPDASNMRAGLEIMNDEFGDLAEMGGSGIRVMCDDLTDDEKLELMKQFRKIEGVTSVSEQENGIHTLYELAVPNSLDQVAMGKEIALEHNKIAVVETSQDGASAEAPMLIGAVSLLLIILFAMCQSWLEPVLFLVSTGIAVLINVGTNALLPSVSVTTNSIVAILQLVLSMDYSIILINRFRQERMTAENSVAAMQSALKLASSPILGSAFTTIVGLSMLVFMKLKIGADLGIVLSKGVLCSLICNFTVLPSLILFFEKGIDKSQKRVLTLPTDKLANFNMRFRIPLTILFLIIFVGSFILHNQTDIIFYNAKASKIEKYFPKKNPIVLVYDNKDEKMVANLMDSIISDNNVDMVISYPSLLQREYTASQMMEAINDLGNMMAGMNTDNMPALKMDMLSEDVLKVAYYAAHNGKEEETMGFNEMADFIIQQAYDPNSLIAKQMDDDLKAKIKMLDEIRHPIPTTKPVVAPKKKEEAPVTEVAPVEKKLEIELTPQTTATPVRTNIIKDNQAGSRSPYTDTTLLLKPMTSAEMASFLTMEAGQAKAVYKLAKRTGGKMTPVEFVHFVTEDILQRKALAMMIKESQRMQLYALQNTMDSTLLAASFASAEETPSLISSVTTTNNAAGGSLTEAKPTNTDSVRPAATPVAVPKIPEIPKIKKAPKGTDPLDVLDEMLYGNKQYTAAQMSQNIAVLGESIPTELLDLLYLYYGGNNHYDESWTMSLEEMVNFLVNSVLSDSRFDAFIDDDMRAGLSTVQDALKDGIGKLRSKDHSIAMIITSYDTESPETYKFIDKYNSQCKKALSNPFYSIGESIMLSEMKAGFNKEMLLVTLLTIAAIFLIVAITFRSPIIAAILVMTVMSGVFINVMVSGFGGGSLLYLAYLIVQSILMGAAIDYGILFANYYLEKRQTLDILDALKESYRCSIHTILTSGLILIMVPAIMTVLVSDPTIQDIVKSISIGAFATVLLILFVLPGIFAATDKIIARKKRK